MDTMDIRQATELLSTGTAMLQWQREEIERLRRQVAHLTRCVDERSMRIRRLESHIPGIPRQTGRGKPRKGPF